MDARVLAIARFWDCKGSPEGGDSGYPRNDLDDEMAGVARRALNSAISPPRSAKFVARVVEDLPWFVMVCLHHFRRHRSAQPVAVPAPAVHLPPGWEDRSGPRSRSRAG